MPPRPSAPAVPTRTSAAADLHDRGVPSPHCPAAGGRLTAFGKAQGGLSEGGLPQNDDHGNRVLEGRPRGMPFEGRANSLPGPFEFRDRAASGPVTADWGRSRGGPNGMARAEGFPMDIGVCHPQARAGRRGLKGVGPVLFGIFDLPH